MFKTTTTVLSFLLPAIIMMNLTSSTSTETFIFAKCSPEKFSPGSTYETNLNSLLSSLLSSTVASRYNNLTKPDPSGPVYGLFQCSVDLDATSCSSCVSRAISLVGTTCPNSYSGFLQMRSCLVRYDKSYFFGVQDKTEMLKKCGQPLGFNDQDALTRVGDVMGLLSSGSGPDRSCVNGDVRGVAQCMGDLSSVQCQDCLADAIGRLRSDCGMSQGGYVYLSKCYARFSYGGSHARQTPNSNFGEDKDDKDNDGIGKTLAIIIGIITLVILLVVFLAFIGKQLRKLQDEKCCK